jgi:Meiotically Up-regulated Gene 113 (MUG113) protein
VGRYILEPRQGETAIYLIAASPDGPTKVGISNKPAARLAQMQTHNSSRLWLYGVYWFRKRAAAECVEKWLLEDKYASKRIEGEWLKIPAYEISPLLAGIIQFKFGQYILSEWESNFVHESNEPFTIDEFQPLDLGSEEILGMLSCVG